MDLNEINNMDIESFKKVMEYTYEDCTLSFYRNEKIIAIRFNNELTYAAYITIDAYDELIHYDDDEKKESRMKIFAVIVKEHIHKRKNSNKTTYLYISLCNNDIDIKLLE